MSKKKEPERSDDLNHESPKGGALTKTQLIENYLSKIYDFRFNEIKQKPEYKEKKQKTFKAIDKYKLLSIKRELDAQNLAVSKDGLLDIIQSDYAKKINPVKEYFEKLPEWIEGVDKDYINLLCDTIVCKNGNDWRNFLKRWIVAVVANVFNDEKCENHTMLVLTGVQGAYKTTWLENLCPKELSAYNYTGKLNLESKDCLTYIAEYLFVNIDDQLKQLHKKDENELKNLITINTVKYRKPYDPIITEHPHLCSFMASVNGNDFLSDSTGSRRFLPFEVETILIEKAQKLDISKVWAQAYSLYKNGFIYWFNKKETEYINARNEVFSMVSIEEELIQDYYRNKPVKNPDTYQALESYKYITSSQILVDLETKTRQRLNKRKLGEALGKLGYEKTQRTIDGKITWVYKVIEKSHESRLAEQTII